MAYIGHERQRGTLKYRCPAEHESWRCPSSKRCNQGKRYGMTVRVKQELDLRRFPPIPRATKKFERLYRGRTAVERVNARSIGHQPPLGRSRPPPVSFHAPANPSSPTKHYAVSGAAAYSAIGSPAGRNSHDGVSIAALR